MSRTERRKGPGEMPQSFDREHRILDTSLLQLLPPRAVSGLISRERLLRRITCAPASASLVLIQAPAGHGKSILMQQAHADCEQRGVCAGWVTLQDSDNDVTRLIRLIQALLDRLERASRGRAAGTTDALGRPAGRASRTDWVLGRLLALDRPVALFIDEFQTLTSPEALTFFRDLLASLPAHVRVIIGSRANPDIGLSRFVVAEQIDVIKASDLLFTYAEVESFFAGINVHLSRREIEAIYQSTGGWPAAVQLYRLSLANAEVRKSLVDINAFQPRRLTEYLTDNVLSIHPHDVQRFFLDTSPLVRMSGPLCEAITGRSDSRELLVKLEDSGLFVRSLDASLQWFRYHSLFSGFLREQLRRYSPQREHQIHTQAAHWFHDNGHLEEALWHAIAAQDFALAAACLERWGTQLVMQGNLMTIERWFEKLPIEEVRRRPKLLVEVAWALAFLRKPGRLGEILKLMEPRDGDAEARSQQSVVRSIICILRDDILGAKAYAEAYDPARYSESDPFSVFEAGATAILKAHLALFSGQPDVARDYLVVGRTCGRQVNAPFTVLGAIATGAVNLMVQGRLNEAADLLSEAPGDACLTLDQSVASAAYAASYIHVLCEANRLGEARKLFDQSFEAIASSAQVDFLSIACTSMVRLYDVTDQPARGNALIEEVESIAHAGSLPRLVRVLAWERVRRSILAGALDRARAIAARITDEGAPVPDGWIAFSEETEGAVINRLRLAIHEGNLQQAHRMIGPALDAAAKQGRVHRRIKLLVLEAMAHHRGGEHAIAFDTVREAVKLAAAGGYVRTFLDEGRLCVELLDAAHRNGTWSGDRHGPADAATQAEADHVDLLLTAAGVRSGSPELAVAGLGESLSSREEEILRLLARGMFNREIGARLFISENTVKYHLKNIYSKLGVKSRSQAINTFGARRLA